MPTNILIRAGTIELPATLDDSPAAQALAKRLPIEITARRWGEEYYGALPSHLGIELAADARDVLEVGELAYWPPGNAFCIFFGPTPASEGSEPRAASEVSPLGRITGDVEALRKLGSTISVRIELKDA